MAWNTIREVVPSMTARVQLEASLPDGVETIDLNVAEWQLISQVGSGITVSRLAKGSGESEFEAASRIAALVKRGLAQVGDSTKTHPGALERYPGVEVSDDPMGAEGPTGWTNELESIAATAEPEPEPEPPLLETDEIFPQADDSSVDEAGGVDFGLKGFAPKPGLSGSELAQNALDAGDEGEVEADDPLSMEAGEMVTDDFSDASAAQADTAEADALELLGDIEALEDLDAAAQDVSESVETDETDEDDEVLDADAETDESAEVSDEDAKADEEVEELEEKGSPLPNLLRRRNKGLLAKELSSLTD